MKHVIEQLPNLAAYICYWKGQSIAEQNRLTDWLLLIAYYKAHRQRPIIDDRTSLRHPIEEEICRCIASGISIDDFIADYVSSHRDASVKMLRRRWYKVAHLLQVYQMYSQPTLTIVLED